MSNADRSLAIGSELNQLETLLQSRGGSATLLADMTAKLADANTQATNAINTVVPLVPAGYPGNKTTLESARTILATVRTDLKAALSDATQIRQLLKGTTNAPTPTPTP
jgi:multidrug resistance efflux pump